MENGSCPFRNATVCRSGLKRMHSSPSMSAPACAMQPAMASCAAPPCPMKKSGQPNGRTTMATSNPFPLSKDELLKAYRTMRRIREFEERVHVEFAKGDIPGFVHLYAGEEAAGTGIMLHLNDKDRIASTHRG